mmetsp:Transcript_42771/g.123630  ORF Transcript_42771/g.123630 Transcript_42771/m.123630 type:complete len:347 (-) Transcript_42771:436-1476(-)
MAPDAHLNLLATMMVCSQGHDDRRQPVGEWSLPLGSGSRLLDVRRNSTLTTNSPLSGDCAHHHWAWAGLDLHLDLHVIGVALACGLCGCSGALSRSGALAGGRIARAVAHRGLPPPTGVELPAGRGGSQQDGAAPQGARVRPIQPCGDATCVVEMVAGQQDNPISAVEVTKADDAGGVADLRPSGPREGAVARGEQLRGLQRCLDQAPPALPSEVDHENEEASIVNHHDGRDCDLQPVDGQRRQIRVCAAEARGPLHGADQVKGPPEGAQGDARRQGPQLRFQVRDAVHDVGNLMVALKVADDAGDQDALQHQEHGEDQQSESAPIVRDDGHERQDLKIGVQEVAT